MQNNNTSESEEEYIFKKSIKKSNKLVKLS